MLQDDVTVRAIERVQVLPPDGGVAWRELYEGPTPVTEPVEDGEADVEGCAGPRSARAAEVLDREPRTTQMVR